MVETKEGEAPEYTEEDVSINNNFNYFTLFQVKIAREITAKKDYYEILGVAKDADDSTIKKAYRKVSTRVNI